MSNDVESIQSRTYNSRNVGATCFAKKKWVNFSLL